MTWQQLVDSFPMSSVTERKGRTKGVTRLVIRDKARCYYRRNIRYEGGLPRDKRPPQAEVVAAFLSRPVPAGVLRSVADQRRKVAG